MGIADSPQLRAIVQRAAELNRPVSQGTVKSKLGLAIEVVGLRSAIGDLCEIQPAGGSPVLAEVVGFRDGRTTLMALSDADGIAPLDRVTDLRKPLTVPTGSALLGRVIDALGQPLDGGPPLVGRDRRVHAESPAALSRAPVCKVFSTGVSAIDGLLTCGRGQRLGVFAGSGVGKSVLMGMIARGASADVNVIALIGERGREVRDFVEDVLGREGLARSVVVVATSDRPPMQRFKGPYTAVTIAEAFREAGRDVLFMMDSVTRFAGAAREIGLAVGEPPTLRGYPPSLFANLPRLVERLGNDEHGSITGLLTVLVDGDDLNEPVSDALRGYLDGHVVLDRRIAARGKFPAINALASVSRLMPAVATREHREAATRLREWLAHYEENRDLIQVGAYRAGADPLLDAAIQKNGAIEKLLHQGSVLRPFQQTLALMQEITRR
jgi:FliI/YscN family ATPase